MNRLIIVILVLASMISEAQNLVPNYSFEAFTGCPKEKNDIEKLVSWKSIPEKSIDYMNSCSKSKWTGTKNVWGEQSPKTGNGYVMIMLNSFNTIDYKGTLFSYSQWYLQVELIEPLKKDQTYCIKLEASLSDESFYSVDHIGALFSKSTPKYYKGKIEMSSEKYLALRNYDNELSDKKKWMPISSYYVAKGGEKVLTIGNFSADLRFNGDTLINYQNHIKTNLNIEGGFYYLDNVTVEPVDPSCECNQCHVPSIALVEEIKEVKDTFEVGKHIILRNIHFETDKASLLPMSHKELTKLVALMFEYPSMKIEIGGHTDNKGSEQYNIGLSERRSQSVVKYLRMNNISVARLSFKGYGMSEPIADNGSEEGRETNRRVEFTIISK